MEGQSYTYHGNDDELATWGQSFTSRNADSSGDPQENFHSTIKLLAACKSGGTFLDVGSGLGRIIDEIKQYAGKVIGLEPDKERFLACRGGFFADDTVEVFNKTSWEYLKSDSAIRFDFITVSMVVQHVSRHACQQILRDVRELMRPDGVAIVGTTHFFEERFTYEADQSPHAADEFDRYADYSKSQNQGIPVRMFSKQSLYREIERAGLEVIGWQQFCYVRPESVERIASQYGVPADQVRDLGVSQYVVVRHAIPPARDRLPPSLGYRSIQPVAALLARWRRPTSDKSQTPQQTISSADWVGNCDGIDGDEVYGWAWRPTSPQSHVEVEQWVEGVRIARTMANLQRPDLLAAGIGDGSYGWRMPLALDPAKLSSQKVEIRVRDGDLLPNGAFNCVSVASGAASDDTSLCKITPEVVGVRDVQLNGWYNDEANELAPGFPISPDDVVVDVGAGDGGMARFCSRTGAKTILIDSDPERLERAVEGVRRQAAGPVEGRVGDAARLPVEDASATRVICTEVLEHVEDPAAVMAELLRIGRPGALYLLSVPGTVSEQLQAHLAPPSYFERPNHIRIFEPDDFTHLVEEAGLTIEQRSLYGFFWTIWWTFFWQAGIELGEQSHPLLDAWNRTWAELLKTPDAARIKTVLDNLAPKNNALVARKPKQDPAQA